MSDSILQVKNLSISFRTNNGKVQAVRDINFDLQRGETLAIVGESGSGKSVTSKAILGISAANAIHENGEILYEDKDLLQIDEDDFHKIRGDKIAMVFQDPLSALNPIIRTGKQLTEAMILNNKAERKDAFKRLGQLRKLINKYTVLIANTNSKTIAANDNNTFHGIQSLHISLEIDYKKRLEHIDEALRLSKALLLDIEKHVHAHIKPWTEKMLGEIAKAVGKYSLEQEKVEAFTKNIKAAVNAGDMKESSKHISDLQIYLEGNKEKPLPDFFAEAYTQIVGRGRSFKTFEECCEDDFMKRFLGTVADVIEYTDGQYKIQRGNAYKAIEQNQGHIIKTPLNISEAKKALANMSVAVENAINRLDISLDSQMYTFKRGTLNTVSQYKEAISKNNKEQKRFNRDKRRYDRESAKGKTPDWKLVPLDLSDLDHIQNILVDNVERMKQKLGNYPEPSKNYEGRAKDLIRYTAKLASRATLKISNSMAKERAIALLREVGIPEPEIRFTQYPFELSGGMRQRVVIAIALSANPDILICDEPTTALDVTIQAQILELINRIKTERGLSIIFITHDLGVVANMADRIAVMYAGKIVEIGQSEEVFYDPKHPYTWALLSSMPDLETKEKLSAIPGTPPNMLFPPVGDAFAQRNKYAMKIDFEQQPPMFKVSDSHYAATWLLHPDAPKVEPPAIVSERINRMKAAEVKENANI